MPRHPFIDKTNAAYLDKRGRFLSDYDVHVSCTLLQNEVNVEKLDLKSVNE